MVSHFTIGSAVWMIELSKMGGNYLAKILATIVLSHLDIYKTRTAGATGPLVLESGGPCCLFLYF